MPTLKFIDLHAHFPMQTPFPPAPFENPGDNWKAPLFRTLNKMLNYESGKPRVSFDRWFDDKEDGAVLGFGSALYDPEDEFFVKSGTAPIPEAFDHLLAQIRNVERAVAGEPRVKIAKHPKEVSEYLEAGQRFMFHTLEGGFSLGGNERHVSELAAQGVASLIPAHLLYRGVATCENGFPPLVYPLFRHELDHQPDLGLSDAGHCIVEQCFRRGIIVDITHAGPKAQADIFAIADGYPARPLISSHNAVRSVAPHPLNLSCEAILRIKASGGVVGVIFYTHWLRRGLFDFRDDFALITDVIDAVCAVTDSDDHVAIGSDLDGFIDPIKTCSNYGKMSRLAQHISKKYSPIKAEKILYRNVLRVLQEGWTGA